MAYENQEPVWKRVQKRQAREYLLSFKPTVLSQIEQGVQESDRNKLLDIQHMLARKKAEFGFFWAPDNFVYQSEVLKELGRLESLVGYAFSEVESNTLLWGVVKPVNDALVMPVEDTKPVIVDSDSIIPKGAEFLLDILTPARDREAVLGDLQEQFSKRISRFGARGGKIWLYKQVLTSMLPLLRRLLALGLGDWLRRHIS
jgi:hypothetical protein